MCVICFLFNTKEARMRGKCPPSMGLYKRQNETARPPPPRPPNHHLPILAPCPVPGWAGVVCGGAVEGGGDEGGEMGRRKGGVWVGGVGGGLKHLTQPKPTDLSGGSTTSAAYGRGISRIWTKSKLAKFRV